MFQREAIEKLVAEVLDGAELRLKIDSYSLEENLETGDVQVRCDVHHERTGEKKVIEGRGVGIVDATFNGLVELYSGDYPSLSTIRFSDFSVKAVRINGEPIKVPNNRIGNGWITLTLTDHFAPGTNDIEIDVQEYFTNNGKPNSSSLRVELEAHRR